MKPGLPPSSRYYEYHEDIGHTTNQCYQLSNLIEVKIRKGHFVHFIEGKGHTHHERHHSTDRVIDVIFGGFTAGGLSNNSRKTYSREVFKINPDASKRSRLSPTSVISFSDEDYPQGMIERHQDALVITAKVGVNSVKKILIDNGSSVDILYHHAFSRMEFGDRKLENTHTPLYAFTGNEVKIVGTIDLPVLFGSMPCQVWKVVKFHVISANLSYNAILGRTTITALKAITSISHLKMKFPTEFGIGEVCGDQDMARQCYLTTVVPKKLANEEQTINQILEFEPKNMLVPPKDNSFYPIGETEEVEVIIGQPDKTTKVGKYLQKDLK